MRLEICRNGGETCPVQLHFFLIDNHDQHWINPLLHTVPNNVLLRQKKSILK